MERLLLTDSSHPDTVGETVRTIHADLNGPKSPDLMFAGTDTVRGAALAARGDEESPVDSVFWVAWGDAWAAAIWLG